MITCKEFPEEVFSTKEELFKKLRENKSLLISQKKMQNKFADAFDFTSVLVKEKVSIEKEESDIQSNPNEIKIVSVINTTNIMDSHYDVHIKGLWNKTVKENKNMLLLDQHRASFEGIISDNVKASLKTYTWKELGLNAEGETEALVFESTIDKERHPYMFEQYSKNRVKNHSVGMRYVKIDLAINSEAKWDIEEKEVWDKYIDQIINKEEAESRGYFWAVTEAKAMEGSAVVFGSNPITPTLSTKSEPDDHSEADKKEPTKVTQTNKSYLYTI